MTGIDIKMRVFTAYNNGKIPIPFKKFLKEIYTRTDIIDPILADNPELFELYHQNLLASTQNKKEKGVTYDIGIPLYAGNDTRKIVDICVVESGFETFKEAKKSKKFDKISMVVVKRIENKPSEIIII